MAGNSNLNDSARNKQDEFYTQLSLYRKRTKALQTAFQGENCSL